MERTRERASIHPGPPGSFHVAGQFAQTHHPASIPSARARIVGIDVARGIAILGMMAVHILDPGPFPWIDPMPENWDGVFAGRSSILFAIIAGISVALMTGRDRPVTGGHLVRARTRILVRAVVLFAVGGVLNMLVHNIAVILEYYAVLFMLALPFLAWPPRRVFQLVAALVTVLPPIYMIVINLALREEIGRPSTMTRLMLTGNYPAIIWIIFILIGLGVGRLELTSRQIQRRLLAIGTTMLIVGYGAGQAAQRLFPPRPRADDGLPGRFDLDRMATMEPHTGAWFEVVGSSGVALAVLALCLMATPRSGRLLTPLSAAGSMALSIYVLHVVSMVWIWPALTEHNQYQFYLGTVVVSLVFASVWAHLFGRGPLERLLTTISRRTATAKRPAVVQVAG
ncbi:MAG TPA: acyltransferase family protein [Thermomicrobiales bacterium]|nr:acyltransferase family protein [Thermomicrobiales bacterium]